MPDEYDKTAVPAGPLPASDKHVENPPEAMQGHLRVDSQPADVSILGQPITFSFSGKTAPNRFLKAPMTERLCYWNKEDEDIVCSHEHPLVTTDYPSRLEATQALNISTSTSDGVKATSA